jgi:hypothetical protein
MEVTSSSVNYLSFVHDPDFRDETFRVLKEKEEKKYYKRG